MAASRSLSCQLRVFASRHAQVLRPPVLLPRQLTVVRDVSGSCRGVHTSVAVGAGGQVLRHIAEQGFDRSFSKWTLDELLRLKDVSNVEQLEHLEHVLHVGISKIVVLLQDLPLGFGSTGPIRSVIEDYVHDVKDLLECSSANKERFFECINKIFARHRGMMGVVARGLAEFQEEITRSFEPFADVSHTNCSDVSDLVPAMRRIEDALDEFFTIRTTLRLLIAHCIQLQPNETSQRGRKVMHELLVRVPDSLRTATMETQKRHVGAICLDTRPSMILIEAYRHAQYMCRRDLNRASQLLVNGIPAEEYLSSNAFKDTHFPYVDIHLYFVFFELLKNAMITSILKVGADEEPPPIHVSSVTGSSILAEHERVVKITDFGEGIRREDRTKVWSYFFTTRHSSQFGELDRTRLSPSQSFDATMEADADSVRYDALQFVRGQTADAPLANVSQGHGLGLPVSRVMARYFGGEIDINSIPRKGTDVYIYL